MAVWVPARSGPTAAVSGDNTLFTVDPGHMVKTETFHIVNTSTTTNITVKLGINASTDASLIIPSVVIPKSKFIDQVAEATLLDSDFLVLNASATGITVTAHYQDLYPHL